MNAGTHRYRVLDTWRYFAAVAVVIYHFENHFAPLVGSTPAVFHQFAHFVDFFFVLSGFVLMHTYGDQIRDRTAYLAFLRKRFARLYPLHVLTSLPWIFGSGLIALLAIQVKSPQDFDPSTFLPTLALVHAWGFTSHPALNFPSWSISSEFFVYFLFPLFALILVRVRAIAGLALAVAIAVVMEATRLSLGMRSFTEATFDFGMLRAVPSFIAGMATYLIVTSPAAPKVSWLTAHGMMLFLLAVMIFGFPTYLLLVLFPLAVGLVALAEQTQPSSALARPFFTHLGDASYGVYMLHTIVQIACVSLVRRFDLTQTWQLIVIALAGIVFTTILAVMSYRFFETPARRFMTQPGAFWPLTGRRFRAGQAVR